MRPTNGEGTAVTTLLNKTMFFRCALIILAAPLVVRRIIKATVENNLSLSSFQWSLGLGRSSGGASLEANKCARVREARHLFVSRCDSSEQVARKGTKIKSIDE